MRLDALVLEAKDLDLAAFRALHPAPGLLFPSDYGINVDLSATRVDTPSQGLKVPSDKTTTAFPVKKAGRREPEKPSPAVFFLVKSSKNPFGNMITVGRASNNDVCLPLSSVSKLHAYFTQLPAGGWSLSDGNATNGTFVAEKRLPTGGASALKDGETVGFGPETIATFYLTEGLFEFLKRSSRAP